ncbi:gfo/Idh/MocA family oxidoreductase [Paenibacillus sp. HJL G12]|uniref:Gfo/Idh/MocA family oxidoreductase n=1 Tax=Paenibacillus dendrobii TaxID=2691084 RepID=A0A7X3IM46_9BACL|nr:Gfo/Idh/MocA family oxidoreductase [Paenibacillus dendrobii]MWV46484.1 gfo/Idh/MocA family oxidoreductase [Paenibacillus dendrobii]
MTLQIGIIGTGWFSQVHADILAAAEGVKVQAFLGTSKEKAEQKANAYGATGYGELHEMLDKEHLDAVYICVPPMSHGPIEEELVRRRIPFLVEKPLGVDAELPRSILAKIEDAQLITSVGYHFRYQSNVDKLKELLQQQTTGMMLGRWMGSMPGVAWWKRQDGSGGQFVEQTTHLVDLLRYLAGEVEEVYALYGNRIKHEQVDGVEVADVGTVTLRMASGLVANISNTCALPEGAGLSQTGLTFYTDQGVLDWNPQRLQVARPGEQTEYQERFNPYVKETEAFIHALRTGDGSRIRSDYADAFRTQAVTCAALEAAATGKPVRIRY